MRVLLLVLVLVVLSGCETTRMVERTGGTITVYGDKEVQHVVAENEALRETVESQAVEITSLRRHSEGDSGGSRVGIRNVSSMPSQPPVVINNQAPVGQTSSALGLVPPGGYAVWDFELSVSGSAATHSPEEVSGLRSRNEQVIVPGLEIPPEPKGSDKAEAEKIVDDILERAGAR